MGDSDMSVGQLATMACILEVTIPKPGNVHRNADFEDTTLQDFLTSAVAIGPVFDQAANRALGAMILDAVRATRKVVQANTNLGMILLLAPLAKVGDPATDEISSVLERSTEADCRNIYQAISMCRPGGIGQSDKHDIQNGDAPGHILEAMQLAQDHDMIARQYVNGFRDVTDSVLPAIENELESRPLTESVIQAHLKTMNRFPDSLICRKNGRDVAMKSAAMAGDVLSSGDVGSAAWLRAMQDFDFWLRADGNRRNPGTTADLIAAALFVGLRRGSIKMTGS